MISPRLILLLLIVSAYLFQEGMSCFFFNKVVVTIYSDLPSDSASLSVHCASKDDDLGSHTLTTNQIYRFAFCTIPFTTLFHCDLYWGTKKKSFDAYDVNWHGDPCNGHTCKWAARTDGIYLAGLKKFDWE